MRFFYTLVYFLVLPIVVIRFWKKDKSQDIPPERWRERFARFPKITSERPLIWIHAVSVGEVIAASPLIHRLLKCNKLELMVTTMTPTGSSRVLQEFGSQVYHVYSPYDLPWIVHRFVKKVNPSLVIIMETEVWPNTLHQCSKLNIPTLLANARMSSKSAKGYKRFKSESRNLFNQFSHVAVQNEDDCDRFLNLGLDTEKISITGSIKFDINIPNSLSVRASELKSIYSQNKRPIVIAASTHEGEDEIILEAFEQIFVSQPEVLLLLVPRHPERFDDVFSLSSKSFNTIRRSSGSAPTNETRVIVCDTMGEMMLLYGCADIAFVGGSLIQRGGHNVIEPACWGVPVISGPYTFNFADISKRLIDAGGMVTANSSESIAQQVSYWINEPDKRKLAGLQAQLFTAKNRGATERLLSIAKQYIPNFSGYDLP